VRIRTKVKQLLVSSDELGLYRNFQSKMSCYATKDENFRKKEESHLSYESKANPDISLLLYS
jgi:hypothetical protein